MTKLASILLKRIESLEISFSQLAVSHAMARWPSQQLSVVGFNVKPTEPKAVYF